MAFEMMEHFHPASKTPPHNLEAEQSTLGSMLLSRQACDKAAEIISSKDFYKKSHEIIFEAILNLIDQNEPVDEITLCEELKSKNKLLEVGGHEYIQSLIETVPSASSVEYYAKIVEEKAILRRLIGASEEIRSLGYSEDSDVTALVDRAEQAVFQVSKRRMGAYFTELPPLLNEVFGKIDSTYQEGGLTTGVPTGFHDIDEMTSGLQPGELIIVAARPSMGKTALALNMAVNAAVQTKKPVAVFSLEMSKEQLAMRMMCSQAHVDAHNLRTGKLAGDDFSKLAMGCSILSKAPLYIDDTTSISAMAMRTKCRRLMSEKGLNLVVVDYLQLMRWHRNTENRNQEISEIARSLKNLARELNIPVIALSQLSRMTERREGNKPMLSDLRESGSIEAEADVVMMIYREKYYRDKAARSQASQDTDEGGIQRVDLHEEDVAEIIIAKQRNGPTGTVKLAFLPKYASFGDLEKHRGEPG